MNLLNQLMESYRQGPRSVLALHPFIPLTRMREKGLLFNNILYVSAGAQFVTVEEGGATAISPQSFEKLLLPRLKT